MRFAAFLGLALGVSQATLAQNMPFDNRGLPDIFRTDAPPIPQRYAGVGGARTQRHTGAGGAGMHHTWKKRRASGRA